jgi:hypothetical protein
VKKRQADAADEDEEIMPDEAVDDDLLADEPAAVREELRRKLKTEGVRTAIDTMLEVCRDKRAQASARATCAIGLMRGAGYLSRKSEEEDDAEGKTPDQMTAAELEAESRRLRARRLRNERIIRRAVEADKEDDGSVFN